MTRLLNRDGMRHLFEHLVSKYLLTVVVGTCILIAAGLASLRDSGTVASNAPEVSSMGGPWVNMGNDIRIVCDAASRFEYEWGITYNNNSPVIRVLCTYWNVGSRITTYPPYPTGDSEPFTWGGVCWIYGTSSSLDDACSVAYHGYYYQDNNGRFYMTSGNGCDALPTVWRRKL